MQYSQKISTPPRLAHGKLQRRGNEERLRTALRIGRMAAPKAEAQWQTLGGTPPPAYHSCSGAKPHCPIARCFGAQCLLIAHEAVSPAHERYAGGGVPPMLAQQFFTPHSSLDLFFTFNVQYPQKISTPPRLAPGKLRRCALISRIREFSFARNGKDFQELQLDLSSLPVILCFQGNNSLILQFLTYDILASKMPHNRGKAPFVASPFTSRSHFGQCSFPLRAPLVPIIRKC